VDERNEERLRFEVEVEEGNKISTIKVFVQTKKSEGWNKYPHSDFFFLYLIFNNETN